MISMSVLEYKAFPRLVGKRELSEITKGITRIRKIPAFIPVTNVFSNIGNTESIGSVREF